VTRPPIYADENISWRLVEGLRARGFDVLTAREADTLGQADDAQLELAAKVGRVLLTFDRRDFRHVHQRFVSRGGRHVGIALLPQNADTARTSVRAAMLLDWFASLKPSENRIVNWNELQQLLHTGYRGTGYVEEDVRLALGL
jgi:hypothetical protein